MDQLAVQKTEQSPSVDLPELAPSDAGRKKKTLWTEKYRAKRFTDLVGDERTHRHVLHWLKCWEAQVFGSVTSKRPNPEGSVEHKKVLLLHGPPGLGKTTLAHVAARQAGYRAVEINASDDRSSGVVKGKIKDILSTEGIQSCGVGSGAKNTVDHRPLCLVIDEIDGVVGGQDGGFIQALIGLINADEVTRKHSGKRTRRGRKNDFRLCRPIVAVCNDLYAPALKPLRQVAEIVQMRPPPRGLVEERLESIFAREGLTTGNGAVRRLIELSSHGSSSGQAGDIRGALINAQWISARLRSANAQTPCLTRQIVEEELGGKTVGKGDGKSSNKGSLSIRDAVDTIFRLDKNAGGSALPMRTASARRVQDLVEALGEFDKITADCFASYPTRHYNDDFRLSKPNMAYEWLYFADLLSSRQAHELAHYLCQPVVAFHHLFASPTASAAFDKDATEDPPPFSGMNADWEAREMTKHHHSVIQTLHSSLDSIRLSQTFKSPASISTELAPYLNMMISPNISPVVIRGKDGLSVSSVRRDSEKALVSRAVEAMTATGVRFEKVRVEAVSDGHNPSWAYRMDPSVDSLSMYPCWKGESAARQPVRYAVRQVLEQEWQKSKILRDQAAREARMGALSQLAPEQAVTTTPTVQAAKPSRSDKKRDFFGRIIEEAGSDQAQTSAQKRRRVGSDKTTQSVWISFHEGYSNAVRKPIRLSEILEGL
ncbi:P-loop containing nucleoside triphosphate hydrolase protein [Ascodesmis nigricans]|uniref:P-loop containing nucleoside triphosphate hydrolase protein n=1 Tax=Ascodesmis nigricans TaxID=341454 RepID=A0A4S2MJW8_9PEZI|nr:P-loop containing nucleoside triphosphate hydrolase protein [Ascodesmis nigricans]